MILEATLLQWFFGLILLASSIAIITVKNPVHASLAFLLTLMSLSGLYLTLSAQFIAVMQILVYAGAILVIFMFVVVLFQDAHQQIEQYKPQSSSWLVIASSTAFVAAFAAAATTFFDKLPQKKELSEDFGLVQSLGKVLYVDFFFPFEAVILLFLIALVGSVYIAKRER